MRKFLILTVIAVLAFACSKDDGNNPNNPNGHIISGDDWGFLKVGNKWEYEIEIKDLFTQQVKEVRDGAIEIYSEEYSAKGLHLFNYSVKEGTSNYTSNFVNGDNFLQYEPFNEQNSWMGAEEFPTVYKNAFKGQKWNYTYDDGDKSFREVVAINQTVTVPASTFNDVMVIEETLSWWEPEDGPAYVWYISKKYGLIMFVDVGGNVFTYRLKKIDLK